MINTIETKHGDFDIAMETRIKGANNLIVPYKLTVHNYKFNLQ